MLPLESPKTTSNIEPSESGGLEVGQTWQMDKGNVVIVRLGKTLVDYKEFRKGRPSRGVVIQIQSRAELLKSLHRNGAVLNAR